MFHLKGVKDPVLTPSGGCFRKTSVRAEPTTRGRSSERGTREEINQPSDKTSSGRFVSLIAP